MTIDTSRETVEELAKFCDTAWVQRGPQAALFLRALARERDEALAREAALREALEEWLSADDEGDGKSCLNAIRRAQRALSSTATVAAARDAALVERGRREWIKAAHADLLARGMNTSALIVACLLPDDDAPGGAVSEYERGRREGVEEAVHAAWRGIADFQQTEDHALLQRIGLAVQDHLRALATSPDGESPSVVRLPGEGDPQPGDLWVHHSGRVYRIDRITNTAHPSAKFPPAVVYVNVKNGTEWSRALSDWHRSFKPAPPAEGGPR
jgi:hypothetical protein